VLENENDGIKVRFQRVDAHCFMASVYAHGRMVGGAKIFRGGMSHRDNSIHLSYDLTSARNGWNEWLSVENDDERMLVWPTWAKAALKTRNSILREPPTTCGPS
jgi:hypothetical protein